MNEYKKRINKVVDYIEANIEKPFTLDELAGVASFSKYHFNRIFRAVVGETPFEFILRVRLEKAAAKMLAEKKVSITEIAFACGFTDKSIFSRNFKNYFGVSASQFRRERCFFSNLSQPIGNSNQSVDLPELYLCPVSKNLKWRTNMNLVKNAEIRQLSQMTLAYVRIVGPYDGNQQNFKLMREKLFAWAGAKGLFGGKDSKFLVMYHDNPEVALSNNLRMSLCVTVPADTKVDGDIGKMIIEPAKYAIATFELTGQEFQQAWNWMYGQWLPMSGFVPDDKPYFEMYADAPTDGKYVIDFCVPVKSA